MYIYLGPGKGPAPLTVSKEEFNTYQKLFPIEKIAIESYERLNFSYIR